MNPHIQINVLRNKYKHSEIASEALKDGFSLSMEYINDLCSSLKVKASNQESTRNIKLLAFKVYADALLKTFDSIISNPTTTKSELAEARELFRDKLYELESLLVKP